MPLTVRYYSIDKILNPERPNRQWRARAKLSYPDGTKKILARYSDKKFKAEQAIRQAVANAQRDYARSSQQTLKDVFDSLILEKRLSGKKAKSLTNNKDYFKRYLSSLADKPITLITYDDLLQIMIAMQEKGIIRSAELVRILLNELYNHALKINKANIAAGTFSLINHAEDLPKPPPAPRVSNTYIWTDEERARFLATSQRQYDATIRSMIHPLFVTMLSAGLRMGEACGIKLEHHEGNRLLIREQYTYYNGKNHHETPKTKASIRDIPISQNLADLLDQHKLRIQEVKKFNHGWKDHGLLFPSFDGTPFEAPNIRRAKTELCKKADVPNIDVHTLRKIFCTLLTKELVQKGIWNPKIVMQIMGHSNEGVAIAVYTQVIEADKEQAFVTL